MAVLMSMDALIGVDILVGARHGGASRCKPSNLGMRALMRVGLALRTLCSSA